MYFGKAFGRLLLGITYTYFSIYSLDANFRAPLVRWSLLMFLIIDLFFAMQEHVMQKVLKKHAK